MKQLYKEMEVKHSTKLRLAILTTIMMLMLVLQACNNTEGMGLLHQELLIPARQEKSQQVMFRQY